MLETKFRKKYITVQYLVIMTKLHYGHIQLGSIKSKKVYKNLETEKRVVQKNPHILTCQRTIRHIIIDK